jgi:hypothetical protein
LGLTVKQGGEGGAVDELARKRKSVHEVECRSVFSSKFTL